MNATLNKAVVLFVPVLVLLGYSIAAFVRRRTVPSLLQLLGAACLVVVVLTHIAEALRAFPAMGWGNPHSIGHYIDLSSAIGGVALLAAAGAMHVTRSNSHRSTPRVLP